MVGNSKFQLQTIVSNIKLKGPFTLFIFYFLIVELSSYFHFILVHCLFYRLYRFFEKALRPSPKENPFWVLK